MQFLLLLVVIILSIIICSQLASTCSEPFTWPEKFDSHYDCLTFGYKESLNKMKEIGRSESNKHGIYIRFVCTPEEMI